MNDGDDNSMEDALADLGEDDEDDEEEDEEDADRELNDKLYDACEKKDFAEVKRLIEQGTRKPDLSCRKSEKSRNALEWFISSRTLYYPQNNSKLILIIQIPNCFRR